MGSIGRYIFRTTFGAFLVVLVSVTLLMWMTQALRNVDLMTSQGQSVFVFIGITALIIPLLMLLIAPIALTVAAAYATLAITILLGYWLIARGLIIEPPAFINNAITAAVEGLARRRTAAATGPAQ